MLASFVLSGGGVLISSLFSGWLERSPAARWAVLGLVAETGFGADETTGAGGSAGTTGAVMFCWFVVCRKGSGLARSSSHVQLESETQARLHAIQRFLGVRGFMGTLTCHPLPLDLIFGAANGVLYLPSKEQAMADFRIAVLAGDGIGPEVIDQ